MQIEQVWCPHQRNMPMEIPVTKVRVLALPPRPPPSIRQMLRNKDIRGSKTQPRPKTHTLRQHTDLGHIEVTAIAIHELDVLDVLELGTGSWQSLQVGVSSKHLVQQVTVRRLVFGHVLSEPK